MTTMTWVPDDLRQGGHNLVALANLLTADPDSHDTVKARVVAEMTAVATQMEGKAADALAGMADKFRLRDSLGADTIRQYGKVMIKVADDQDKTIQEVNQLFNF